MKFQVAARLPDVINDLMQGATATAWGRWGKTASGGTHTQAVCVYKSEELQGAMRESVCARAHHKGRWLVPNKTCGDRRAMRDTELEEHAYS